VIEKALNEFLNRALTRRGALLAQLAVMRAMNNTREITRVEFAIARCDGAITFLTNSSTVH
jgi:hypothetical protein